MRKLNSGSCLVTMGRFVLGVVGLVALTSACTASEFDYQGSGANSPDCGDGCGVECPTGTQEIDGQCVSLCGPWGASVSGGGPASAVFADDRVIAVGTNPMDSGRIADTWAFALDVCRGQVVDTAHPWASSQAVAVGATLFQDELYVVGNVKEPKAVFLSRLSKLDLLVIDEETLTLPDPEPEVQSIGASTSGVWLAGTATGSAWAAKVNPAGNCPLSLSGSNISSVRVTADNGTVWFASTDKTNLRLHKASDGACSTSTCGCTAEEVAQLSLPAGLDELSITSVSTTDTDIYVAGSVGTGGKRRGVVFAVGQGGDLKESLDLDLSAGQDEVNAVLAVPGGLYIAAAVHVESPEKLRAVLRRYALPLTDTPEVDVVVGDFRAIALETGPDGDVVVVGDGSGQTQVLRCDALGSCSPDLAPSDPPK